jgi:hypothetical protein
MLCEWIFATKSYNLSALFSGSFCLQKSVPHMSVALLSHALETRLPVAVQMLPRSSFNEATFHPVFKPPAPDPPRNLPPVIRAGTVVPPVRSSLQLKTPSDAMETVDSSSGVFEVNTIGVTVLVVLIAVDVLLLTICACCGMLLLPSSQHPRESLLNTWMQLVLKKPLLRKEASFSQTRSVEMVCLCSCFCLAPVDVILVCHWSRLKEIPVYVVLMCRSVRRGPTLSLLMNWHFVVFRRLFFPTLAR